MALRMAFRHTPGSGPAVVFLPGYMSDMAGSKAGAVFDWCAVQGRECLLLDYSGCGESERRFCRWHAQPVARGGAGADRARR